MKVRDNAIVEYEEKEEKGLKEDAVFFSLSCCVPADIEQIASWTNRFFRSFSFSLETNKRQEKKM